MHLPAKVQSALGSIDDLNKLKQLPQEKEISDLVRELVRRNGRITQDMHLPPNIPGGFYRGYEIFDDDDVNPERLILASIFSGPSGFQWP